MNVDNVDFIADNMFRKEQLIWLAERWNGYFPKVEATIVAGEYFRRIAYQATWSNVGKLSRLDNMFLCTNLTARFGPCTDTMEQFKAYQTILLPKVVPGLQVMSR